MKSCQNLYQHTYIYYSSVHRCTLSYPNAPSRAHFRFYAAFSTFWFCCCCSIILIMPTIKSLECKYYKQICLSSLCWLSTLPPCCLDANCREIINCGWVLAHPLTCRSCVYTSDRNAVYILCAFKNEAVWRLSSYNGRWFTQGLDLL